MTKKLPYDDPRRRCLRVGEWPEGDRLAWEAAIQPGDLLDGTVGPAFHWSKATQRKRRKGYGRWLTFLITSGRFDRTQGLAERITPENIEVYIEELRSLVESWTVWGRIEELRAMASVMAPDHDWVWLRGIVRRLEGLVKASKNKIPRLQAAGDIAAWATREMDDLIKRDNWEKHTLAGYRNALMIGLLIACPTLRYGNLRMIEIDRHLVRMTDGYRLDYSAPETKTRKPLSIPVPSFLTLYLEHYLLCVRQVLLGANKSTRLWINYKGEPLSKIYNQICETTEKAFGKPINPHLFRDCAVTTVALEDPEHIGIAAPILGHTDSRTTEEHYIQANAIVAGRRLRQSVDQLKEKYRPRRRDRSLKGDPR